MHKHYSVLGWVFDEARRGVRTYELRPRDQLNLGKAEGLSSITLYNTAMRDRLTGRVTSVDFDADVPKKDRAIWQQIYPNHRRCIKINYRDLRYFVAPNKVGKQALPIKFN